MSIQIELESNQLSNGHTNDTFQCPSPNEDFHGLNDLAVNEFMNTFDDLICHEHENINAIKRPRSDDEAYSSDDEDDSLFWQRFFSDEFDIDFCQFVTNYDADDESENINALKRPRSDDELDIDFDLRQFVINYDTDDESENINALKRPRSDDEDC